MKQTAEKKVGEASEKATEIKKGVQGAASDIKDAAERGKAKG